MPINPTPTDLADAARYRKYAARARSVNDHTFWHNAAQRLLGLPTQPTTARYRYERITWDDDGMATPVYMPDERTCTIFEKNQTALINTAHSLVGKWAAIHDFGANGGKATRHRRVMRVLAHFIAMGYTVQRRKVYNNRKGITYEYKITQD